MAGGRVCGWARRRRSGFKPCLRLHLLPQKFRCQTHRCGQRLLLSWSRTCGGPEGTPSGACACTGPSPAATAPPSPTT
ncbi:unnamed protein product, partial [Heterosigma akashiwo]